MRAGTFSFTVTLCLFASLADSNLLEGYEASISKNISQKSPFPSDVTIDGYNQHRTLVNYEKEEFGTPITEEVKPPSNLHREDNGTKYRTIGNFEKSWTDIPALLDEPICDYGGIGYWYNWFYFQLTELNRQAAIREQKDIFGAMRRTTCLSTCHTSEAVRVVHHDNNTYHFVPIESECNLRKDCGVPSGEYNHRFPIIIGSLGILLFAAVLSCIVSIVWMNRKSKTIVNDGKTDTDVCCNHQGISEEVTEPEYDDADVCNSRRISDVSYVYDDRPLPEKQTKSEYDYAYIDPSNVR